MSHKKAGGKGSSGCNTGRGSNKRRRKDKQGVVRNCGEKVKANSIVVFAPKKLKCGKNVYKGKNAIHAQIDGIVEIKNKKVNVRSE